MVLDHEDEYASQWEAICSVAEKLGPTAETVRLWVRRAETDRGVRSGPTSDQLAELNPSSGPKQLRDRLARSEVELASVKEREMARAWHDVGLSPDEGPGKAYAQLCDGEPGDLTAYLEAEYGYVYEGPENPLSAAITDQYSRLDAMSVGAGSVPAVTPWDQQLAKAEATGDTDTSMAMKGDQVARMLRDR
jgi:transposase-like protein